MAVKVMEKTTATWDIETDEEALLRMEMYFNKLFSEECSPADKPTYYEICRTLYKNWECIRDKYVMHPRKRFYADRLRKKQPLTYNKERQDNVFYTDKLSQCAVEGSGLYFITQISEIDGAKAYAVKVGMTDDIEQRLQVYRSHNPFVCFNNTFLPCGGKSMKQMESNCSMFIKRYARNDVRAAGEWTIVSEEDYLMLCDIFSDHDTFCAIAEGLK